MRVWLAWLLVSACVSACSNKNVDACATDDDCRYLNSCDEEGCCSHKDLMPLKPPEAGGTIVIFAISALANAGGVGGGPIMTAMNILLFYFSPKEAIPLSQIIIAAGALVSFSIRAFMRHPTKNRPLLEYHVCMIIIPSVLFGSVYGVMVNKILPNIALMALLTAILVFLTLLTLKNGVKAFKAENVQRAEAALKAKADKALELENETLNGDAKKKIETPASAESPADEVSPERVMLESDERRSLEAPVAEAEKPEISHELANIYKAEARQFPILSTVWIVVIVIYVALGLSIRGGSGTSFAGIPFCGEAYRIFFGLWSSGMLLLCLLPFVYLLRLKKTYDRLGYDYDEFDIRWTFAKCVEVWTAGLIGGFLGGMLGFGASLLLAPVLVHWKMRSPIVGPTAALMTLIGSAIAVMQFAEQGMLNGAYAGWLGMSAFIGSLVGVLSVTHIMKAIGRASILVMILACVLGIAMFMVPIYTIVDTVKKENDGKADYSLQPYCG